MNDPLNILTPQNGKNQEFVIDKIFHPLDVHFDTNSLSAWLSYYYSVHVNGAPEKTQVAKKNDLAKFIRFFQMEVGHDFIDSWTPAVSKHFQKRLSQTISEKTGKAFKATLVNRTMATIRHVGPYLPRFSKKNPHAPNV